MLSLEVFACSGDVGVEHGQTEIELDPASTVTKRVETRRCAHHAAHDYHALTHRMTRGMQTLPHASAHISSATQTAALPQSFARLESS
jgi:hypothetical protein